MKRHLIFSYLDGIIGRDMGESYRTIIRYFIPEFISAFVLYSMPQILDSLFVGSLLSTASYATLGTTNNLLHFITKLAEGVQVGIIILAGQFNGAGNYKEVGTAVRNSFWLTCIIGLIIGAVLYGGAYWVFWWYGVSPEIITLGIPFLRLKAISIFFTCIYFVLVGFLRAIKNTWVPMYTFVMGSIVFVISDYVLMFGKCGMPALGLLGSGIASIIQSLFMLILIISYIVYDESTRKYQIHLFSGVKSTAYFIQLCRLSLPVVIDKATLALAYVWLLKMICPMGTHAIACYSYVKDLERFAFLPAIAFAQVVTFLASNDSGRKHWINIKTNIKKIGFLASIFVGMNLMLFTIYRGFIVQWFDRAGDFGLLASGVFPVLSVLVFFDLAQLILSGALRGSGNVKIVMIVRLLVCGLYFVPVSWWLSQLPITNSTLKFLLIYGSFYVGNALMSLAYISFFRGTAWQTARVQEA